MSTRNLRWLLFSAACALGMTYASAPVLAEEPASYWVFFSNKDLHSPGEIAAAYAAVGSSYHPDSIERRRERSGSAQLFTTTDLPVSLRYVGSVLATGAALRHSSNWLNAVSVTATSAQLADIAALANVDHVQPVGQYSTPQVTPASPAESQVTAAATFYGSAQGQLDQIKIPAVHALGYTGTGVTIGVLDTGFRRTHEAFNEPGHPIQVLAEQDFVANPNDFDTSDTTNGQHVHGTYILGTIGGYKPNTYVGGAYNASFLLAKTENVPIEVPAEEDDWVAGLEWLEANGADLVTSSLGYIDWYSQAQLNGATAVTTIAANIANAAGLPIINAAGNEGNDGNPATSHLIAPSDAPLVITVGAVTSSGALAGFTSDGPTADGRIKPEVVAQGVGTATVDPNVNNAYAGVNGTSLSTPLVASAVALMLDANPSLTVRQVRHGLFTTANSYAAPDPLFRYGYGLINAFDAVRAAEAMNPQQYVVEMVSGSPVTLSQTIDTPSVAQPLTFGYQFLTTTGVLELRINNVLLATINAPATLEADFLSATIAVGGALLNLNDVEIQFRFDGPAGSRVLVDNVLFNALGLLINGDFETGELDPWTFGVSPGGSVSVIDLFAEPAAIEIPEPNTLVLAAGLLCLVRWRGRRKTPSSL